MFDATIAIAVFYRADDCLKLVLESILRDGVDPLKLQVVICDDCCPVPRATMEALLDSYRARFGRIDYFRHEERDGFRKTFLLQKAIEVAEGEVFITLDGDCVLANNALSKMVKAARKNSKLLFQGQRHFLYQTSIDWALNKLDTITDFDVLKQHFTIDNTKQRKNRQRYRRSLKAQQANSSGRYEYASGHFMGISMAVAKKYGMLQKSNRGYFEDTDFAKRMFEEEGIDLWELHNTEVLHLFEHH